MVFRAFIAVTALFSSVSTAGSATCPYPLELSCHNTTAVANTCCFNAPGGQLLQTQFWDTDPVTGPNNSWTVHGLWPDNCDGTYEQYCDSSREYTNITEILQAYNATELLSYMQEFWVSNDGSDESFWEHEWGKHGTCISTFEPSCYEDYQHQEEVVDFFNRTALLYQTLNTYEFLANASILPSSTQNYSLSDINDALAAARSNVSATVSCTDAGALEQVWYYFNVEGSVQTGIFVPTAPDGEKGTCPDSVVYLPKGGSDGGDGDGGGNRDEEGNDDDGYKGEL